MLEDEEEGSRSEVKADVVQSKSSKKNSQIPARIAFSLEQTDIQAILIK